jgi:hypothetical protein
MGEISVGVIGVEPPCKRCQATLKNVEEAVSEVKANGFNVRVLKLNMASKEVVAKYGVVISPSLAVNGSIKVAGRVPDKKEVERILRAAIR